MAKQRREVGHSPGCPRLQFWDAGDHDAECTCDEPNEWTPERGVINCRSCGGKGFVDMGLEETGVECSECQGAGIDYIATIGDLRRRIRFLRKMIREASAQLDPIALAWELLDKALKSDAEEPTHE